MFSNSVFIFRFWKLELILIVQGYNRVLEKKMNVPRRCVCL